MCLIAFAHQFHPEFPLILIANRDEFYNRPTRPAQFWSDEGFPTILAGKDLNRNGTWLGISKSGKWAALTNYRDLTNIKSDAPTRGNLVLDYLKSNDSPLDYLKKNQNQADFYNGFNLLLGTSDKIYHYSNISKKTTQIPPGIHGLSNAFLNTNWEKSESLKQELEKEISEKKWKKENLLKFLLDETQAKENNLPSTGLSYDMEKALSSRFIRTENYGTRCSTFLAIDKNGKTEFHEQTYQSGTQIILTKSDYIFSLTKV